MSDTAPTSGSETGRDDAGLELSASYEPDEEREARGLLLILGLPPDEIENVVGDLGLESPREM